MRNPQTIVQLLNILSMTEQEKQELMEKRTQIRLNYCSATGNKATTLLNTRSKVCDEITKANEQIVLTSKALYNEREIYTMDC